MAARISKDRLFKTMEEKQLPYYTVTDGRDLIDSNMDEHNVDKSIELLNELFEDLDENIITIKISDKTNKERAKGGRDYSFYEFKVKLKAKEETAMNGLNSTILNLLEKNNALQRQFEILRKEHEIEEIRKELKELKESKDHVSPMEKMVMQTLSGLFAGSRTNTVGMAGANDVTIDETHVTAQERVKDALIRLAKIDKELPQTLELLADFAEAKPKEYESFKPLLKSMV